MCSVAYNDVGAGVSYTSAHCGPSGNSGQRVAIVAPDGTTSREVGTFMPSASFDRASQHTANDWAAIYWDADVTLEPNRYGNGTRAQLDALRKGDRVCMFGGASQKTTCGSFVGRLGNNVYWQAPEGIKGDSGSPVWVERAGEVRGLVGAYSGASIITGSSGQSHALLRASAWEDGRNYAVSEEVDLVAKHFNIAGPVSHEVDRPIDTVGKAADLAAGSAAEVEQSALAASSQKRQEGSSWQAGTLPVVAAIVIGVLVAAAPELARLVDIARGLLAR